MGLAGFRNNNDFARISRMLSFDISLPNAGKFSWRGRNRLPENRLFVVVGPKQGKCGEVINHSNGGTTHSLEAGYTYFMPRDLDLEFEFLAFEFASFHFSLELFSGWDVFAGQKECRRLKNNVSLTETFISMMYEKNIRLDHAIALRGTCFQLIAPFCPKSLNDVKQSHLLREHYGKMLEYIRNEADAQTGIDDLAEVAGMSRDRLSRVFSRDAGISLKKYLERELIRQASHILISGKNVRETAESLNFSSEYYFSRFFHKPPVLLQPDTERELLHGFLDIFGTISFSIELVFFVVSYQSTINLDIASCLQAPCSCDYDIIDREIPHFRMTVYPKNS